MDKYSEMEVNFKQRKFSDREDFEFDASPEKFSIHTMTFSSLILIPHLHKTHLLH